MSYVLAWIALSILATPFIGRFLKSRLSQKERPSNQESKVSYTYRRSL